MDNASNPTSGERLQKALASLGLGSRRKIEEMIKEGRVELNGKVATLGDRMSLGDKVSIDGRMVKINDKPKVRRVIAYHKPEGEICAASDPDGRTTVFERLPKLHHDRWVMIGRLDLNSSGLLLFTNDGELAHSMMHPSNEVLRTYAVRVLGDLTTEIQRQLTNGVKLEDGEAKFDRLVSAGGEGANKWYHVDLKEGRNREVRRMFEIVGLKVSRLLRIKFGPIDLPSGLKQGRWSELESHEIDSLLKATKVSSVQGGISGVHRQGHLPGSRQEMARRNKKAHRVRPDAKKR